MAHIPGLQPVKGSASDHLPTYIQQPEVDLNQQQVWLKAMIFRVFNSSRLKYYMFVLNSYNFSRFWAQFGRQTCVTNLASQDPKAIKDCQHAHC